MNHKRTAPMKTYLAAAALACLTALFCISMPTLAFAESLQPDPLDHAAMKAAEIEAGESELKSLSANAWTRSSLGWLAEDGATIIPGALVKGIDVSSHQGTIDWDSVKADGISFAILRVGYGGDYYDQDDSTFAYNASECKRLGIPFGVYIYSYAYNADMALSEADHVLRVLGGMELDYPVYYDLEYLVDGRPGGISGGTTGTMSNSELAYSASVLCQHIAQAGYTPGIYANLYWWNNFLTDSVFNNWERWVAQYPYPGGLCTYAGEYKVWQAADDAHVAGVSGNVDVNFDYYPYRGGANYRWGDLNINGVTNIVDAQIVYDLATDTHGAYYREVRDQGIAWTEQTVRYLADVNFDGHVDASDALAIQYAFLHGM